MRLIPLYSERNPDMIYVLCRSYGAHNIRIFYSILHHSRSDPPIVFFRRWFGDIFEDWLHLWWPWRHPLMHRFLFRYMSILLKLHGSRQKQPDWLNEQKLFIIIILKNHDPLILWISGCFFWVLKSFGKPVIGLGEKMYRMSYHPVFIDLNLPWKYVFKMIIMIIKNIDPSR